MYNDFGSKQSQWERDNSDPYGRFKTPKAPSTLGGPNIGGAVPNFEEKGPRY